VRTDTGAKIACLRIKLFAACLPLIVVSLPLLPGLGCRPIAAAVTALEREFPALRRVLDFLQASDARAGRSVLAAHRSRAA